jgi:hypothetical protein
MTDLIYISPGNDKLGPIPNISLTPVASCAPGILHPGG